MASFAFIFGNLLFDKFLGTRVINTIDRKSYSLFYISSCLILMVSGLINMILLIKENKYQKDKWYQIREKILILKFVFTFLLTPVLEKIFPIRLFVDISADSNKNNSDVSNFYFNIRFYVVLIIFLLSPFLRFF